MSCSAQTNAIISGVMGFTCFVLVVLVIAIVVQLKTIDKDTFKKMWIAVGVVGGIFITTGIVSLMIC